jgi:hypothetical protein
MVCLRRLKKMEPATLGYCDRSEYPLQASKAKVIHLVHLSCKTAGSPSSASGVAKVERQSEDPSQVEVGSTYVYELAASLVLLY